MKRKRRRLVEEAPRKAHTPRMSVLEMAKAVLRGEAVSGGPPVRVYHSPFPDEVQARMEEEDIKNRAIGEKQREGAKRGGESRQDPKRDLKMWREFERRRPTSSKSDTALKVEIGRQNKLGRSAAIDACNRGRTLQKLSGT